MTSQLNTSQAQLIVDAIRAALFDLHTGLAAKIVSEPLNGAVDVQPLIRRVWLDEEDEEDVRDLPVIQRVPLQFPCGKGWSITWPVETGDLVYLAFAERSLDRWKDAPPGTAVDPIEARAHSLADAVATPALRPLSSPLQRYSGSALRIGRQDGSTEIELSADGSITIKAQTVHIGTAGREPMVKGQALFALLDAIASAIGGIAPGSNPANIIGVVAAIKSAITAARPGVLSQTGDVQ